MKKNKAVHKGNGLLPYPVIVSASQGDILAMNVVLCHYEPYIARLSMHLVNTGVRIAVFVNTCFFQILFDAYSSLYGVQFSAGRQSRRR